MENGKNKKLIVYTFSAGMFLGLLFTSASFIYWRHRDTRESLFYFTTTQAKLISSNVACSLIFSDRKGAEIVLETLKAQHYIAFAGVYDCKGELFSYYCRDDLRHKGFIPAPPTRARFTRRDGFLIVSEPVIVDHELVGIVCLWTRQ